MQKTWSWSITGYNFLSKPHEEVLQICLQSGFSAIEGAPEQFSKQTEAELESIAAQYREAGLRIDSFHLPFTAEDDIVSFYETARRRAVDNVLRSMERAACLGARAVVQHPSTNRFDVDLEGLDNYLRQMDKSLQSLLPRAEKLGQTIALENMLPGQTGPRLGSKPEHFQTYIEKFAHPNLGFCLDTGHALVAGGPEGADAFFQIMAPHMAAFHLADNAGDRDSHLAPGHGLVDWDTVFRRTAEIGFSHPMCIETPPFAPGPNHNYSLEAWRHLVSEADALVEKALGNDVKN